MALWEEVKELEDQLGQEQKEAQEFVNEASRFICKLWKNGVRGLSKEEYEKLVSWYHYNIDADAPLTTWEQLQEDMKKWT